MPMRPSAASRECGERSGRQTCFAVRRETGPRDPCLTCYTRSHTSQPHHTLPHTNTTNRPFAMDHSRMSLAFCKLRLRSQIMSRSEASKRLLALRNQGPSTERQELESQLREDALFQSRMEELRQSMLPRLEEILRELLKCRRQICLPNEGRAQLAINILCEEILSKGLKGAQHIVTYVYGNQETPDQRQFIHWHENASAQQESSMRITALREKVDDLTAKLADREDRLKDRGVHDRRRIAQLQEQLQQDRAAGLRKIGDLEKQQGDNLTALNAGRVELERVRSELQRVLNKSKEGESEQEEATKAELASVRSDLKHVQIKLAESKKMESMYQADLEATKVNLESACSVAKRAREMLEDERKNATTLRLNVERRTLEANAELEHVRSELKHAQTELKAERDKSTEAAFKYQADLKTAEVESEASRSELQGCRASLTYNRQYQTTLYARKAELERAHSEVQHMRAELDAERDRSTKAESENQRAGDRGEGTKLKNNAAATKHPPHPETMKGTLDGERLRREGRDSMTPEYLINPEWEQSTSALQDAYGSSAPASPAVPASGPEPAARPLKTPRLSAQHKYATQPNAFKIEYVGPLAGSPEALQLPEPPEGKSWLDYYKRHGLAKLSEAQSSKANGQKVALGVRDTSQLSFSLINRPRHYAGTAYEKDCPAYIVLSLHEMAKTDALPACSRRQPDVKISSLRISMTHTLFESQCQSFLAQAVREAFVKFHNAAVLNRKVPGRWMGDGADEFTAKYVPPPVVRRPQKKINPNDHTAAVASMVQPCRTDIIDTGSKVMLEKLGASDAKSETCSRPLITLRRAKPELHLSKRRADLAAGQPQDASQADLAARLRRHRVSQGGDDPTSHTYPIAAAALHIVTQTRKRKVLVPGFVLVPTWFLFNNLLDGKHFILSFKDNNQASQHCILRAMFEICLKRGWAVPAKATLDLCKMVEKRMWGLMTPLRQFKGVPSDILRKAEGKQFPWYRCFDLAPSSSAAHYPSPLTNLCMAIKKHVLLKVQRLMDEEFATVSRRNLISTPNFDFGGLFTTIVRAHGCTATHSQPHTPLTTCLLRWDEKIHGGAQTFLIMVDDVDGEIHLDLPEKFPPPTPLLDLQVLPLSALQNQEFEAIYSSSIQTFNKIQSQVF
ncbi:hypothetical protein GGX14DRAFT_402549 [Mycena pura]|uniref:SEC63 domain-containing protein n=1 Tax=Mycena pura TaxID=153505 RepID=A0AAD6UYE2_9AGAR|nr:hypothetical protein GGX14DRAFT_402549 [Mycena pura]